MASELWGAGEIQCLRDGGRSPHSSSCICRIQLEFQFLRHFFVLLSAVLPVTTLRQRLLQPDFQPICASQLYPRHKHLLIKRSLRCRVGNSIQKSAFSRLTELGCWETGCVSLLKETAQCFWLLKVLSQVSGNSTKGVREAVTSLM